MYKIIRLHLIFETLYQIIYYLKKHKDIIYIYMDDLLEKLSKEQLNRFNKPWAKLDKGLRKNRIIFFAIIMIVQNNKKQF